MSTSITSAARPRLAPLQCVNCNAPLVVVEAPSLVCRFCGATNVIPQVYREELRLTRDLDSATREAAEHWLRLAQIKVPRWWFICAAFAPFVLLTGGLVVLLVAALLGAVSGQALPGLLTYVWLILIPAQLLAANVAMKNVLVSGAANVGAAFAAAPPSAPGEPPNCRQCGAPLSVRPDDVLVRCIYCETESIVRLEESAMETLRTRVASAQSSLAQAMSALTKHAKLAGLETRGRTYVIAGLLVLPLVWSFVESWNSSYWGLLVALDVFVLAMCVFWNVREAFLPPVTIEELETLLGSSADETRSDDHQHLRAGTRGWYDNASDKVNFIVPIFVTLIFVAIQVIVLRAKVISVVILIFVSSFVCSAQQFQSLEQREKILVPKVFKNSHDETLLYRLFIPPHHDPRKKYPLVLYLHGGGGRGNDNRKQIDGGNGYLIDLFTGNDTQARYSSFVVAPQSPMKEGWIEDDTITPTRQLRLVYEMIGELLRTYKLDDARVYVAGQSMGGFGTLAIISEYPRMFAAGVVLCGGGDQAKVSRLANTPIWAFHGAKDESVPVERSRTIVAGIRNAGGQARYTEYADGDHLIWLKVVKETELLPWLFTQRR